MDYTTLALVKASMDGKETAEDTTLSWYISAASKYLDKLCTSQPLAPDYFKLETVVDEFLTNGVVDHAGRLTVFPHKPVVSSVSAISYRSSMAQPWVSGDALYAQPVEGMVIFEGSLSYSDLIYTKISYTGGLAATVADLPKDFIDLATLMTVRLFKEARSGLGDSIGVVELGEMIYTKAFPQRLIDSITRTYGRTAPWM